MASGAWLPSPTLEAGTHGARRGGGGEAAKGEGALPEQPKECGTLEGVAVEGDRCNLGYLEACQDVLEGLGPVEHLSWFACSAQILICIASSMAEPPPLIWKNAAAALEQMQLISNDDANSEKGKMLEETKLGALYHYASAHLCKIFGHVSKSDGKEDSSSPAASSSSPSSSPSTTSYSTASDASAPPRASGGVSGREGGGGRDGAGGTEGGREPSGDAELDNIIQILAAAGIALPC